MTDFQNFIERNGLKKKDLASFLSVSNAFITQLCAGTRSIPADKLALIKANRSGWETSMLSDSSVVNSGDGSNINNGRDQRVNCDERVADLSDKFISLLNKKDEQIDRLISIIEKR